jgi:hypothetical protein
LSAPDLFVALAPVLEAFDALGIRYYVGGSIASSAHGLPRASIDADVIAELGPRHVEPFAARLSGAYYLSPARLQDAVARRGSFNLIHLDTMVKVDVFVSKGRPFDRRAMDRAQVQTGDPATPAVRLATAEDIVLAKLEWYRLGGQVSERQWTDILGVLRSGGATLDTHYLREGALELGVEELLARALAEASGL